MMYHWLESRRNTKRQMLSSSLVWTLIVHLWDKVGYEGSIKWLVLKFIEAISVKRSEKFNIKRDATIKEVPEMVRKERTGFIVPKK